MSVDEAVMVLTEQVSNILNRSDMAPMKTFQQRRQYALWLSDETKALMAERYASVKQARFTSEPEDLETATMLKNTCTHVLRTEIHCYLKLKLDKCEEDIDVSGIWKNIRGFPRLGAYYHGPKFKCQLESSTG